MQKIKKVALFQMFLFAAMLYAQEDSEIIYVIREIEFDVDGISNPYYLIAHGEFAEGERIKGTERFDNYIERKIQLLNNQRVLDNTATRIDYTLGDPEPDGALPVKLLVHVKDTWNFLILPYPKYDSNDGFSLTLKGRDYNFLGTMNPVRIDLGYRLYDYNDNNRDNDRHTFNFLIDSDTPFRALGFDWNLNFDHELKYTLGEGLKGFFYRNVTGLSLRVPWKHTNFNFGFNHFIVIHEENTNDDGPTGTYREPYGATELYANWSIPLGIEVGQFGGLYYTPGLSGKIHYPYAQMDNGRKPVTTFSHSIGFGRVDWNGNFRKGLSASIGNSFNWYFDRYDVPLPLEINLNASASYYQQFNTIAGMTARLRYNHRLHWPKSEFGGAGDVIRGVVNNDLKAYYMLSLNLDFPVRVLRFWPSEWFNISKLRYFNFEMFFSPFLDLALLEGPSSKLNEGGTKFSFDDMIATTGLEVVVYPGITRSLLIRGSVGYNIKKIRERGGFSSFVLGFFPKWDEIYIGVDLYY